MRRRGSQARTGGGSNAYAATWPARPWPPGACASSIRHIFPSRSKHRGRMGPAICSSLRMELLEKLAVPVPPPRLHLLRCHGVLAPRARDRHCIVPTQPLAESPPANRASSAGPCGHRLGWAALLARVFAPDLSACPACGGRLRIIAALTDPASIRRYLVGVGLPPKAPPRAPPQPRFEFSV